MPRIVLAKPWDAKQFPMPFSSIVKALCDTSNVVDSTFIIQIIAPSQIRGRRHRRLTICRCYSAIETEKVIKHPEALEHFRRGLVLYQAGSIGEAMAAWRDGVAIEPDNFNIRKQIWAVEHPEKFYGDKVDYEWQRKQMENGL